MEEAFAASIERELRPLVKGKSVSDALNTLLLFMQQGFKYQTDTKLFGHEKNFFCEENFYYPANDCEDRAILFARIVRLLFGYDAALMEYDDHVEVKVYSGKASLRRKLTECNDSDISKLVSGLPERKGGGKVIDIDGFKDEKTLRIQILKSCKKAYPPHKTKPAVDFIGHILEEAHASGKPYDVSDLRMAVYEFAANSTHNADECCRKVDQMPFASDIPMAGIDGDDVGIIFYDVEVFPNLLVVCWKRRGPQHNVVQMINPSPADVEELARRYSDDVDKVLPEAGALETTRSYREKKAKPLYKKIVDVLRALYNKYLDLINSFNRLNDSYNRLQQRYASLDASFDRLAEENKSLKQVAADYDALCRGYGADRVEEQVRAIREREAEQKRQRRMQRQRHSIGAR